jgi:argininosuccinate lyase
MGIRKTIVGSVDPAVLSFTAGEDAVLDLQLAEADCIGSAAHVTMLSRVPIRPRLFSAKERDQVVAELVKIIRRVRAAKFRITAQDQDVHLAVEKALTKSLGDLGRKIHTARSRNDQVAVDLRLYSRTGMLALLDKLLDLADALLAIALKHQLTPMVGRTHLQPAMPGTVGLWASAHAESLFDDASLVWAAYELNNRSPLGSAAGYGVGLKIDRDLTARLLGFTRPIANVLYASNARGKCESVILSAASQVMLTLSRLAEDLILFTMPEFGYFSLPPEFCTGSSIMPQKSNPDVLELVRARASRVLSCMSSVTSVIKSLPSGYNRDLQETKGPFLDGLNTTSASLEVMGLLVRGLGVDKKALKKGFSPAVFATDAALEKVARGVPFRNAYDQVKSELDGLEQIDLGKAIAGRFAPGCPADPQVETACRRASDMRALVDGERKNYYNAVSKLLGVKYPGLTARKTGSKRRNG